MIGNQQKKEKGLFPHQTSTALPGDRGNDARYSLGAWVVAVDMGYGHQRTAYPLRHLAPNGKVVNANNYEGIPRGDKNLWYYGRFSYEFISRFRRVPFVGEKVWAIFDYFQRIMGYYPKRDLSKISLNQRIPAYLIKRKWGKDLIKKLKKNPLPFISTFFLPAFMAEIFDYPNDIYCIICDADIARSWAAIKPELSEIKYLVPNSWTRDRLKLYGVKPENIYFTGYPLPKENIGGENMQTLKKDLSYRILNLDPKGKYRKIYKPLIKGYLGELPKIPNHPPTIMFSIGGAGAQKEIGAQIINNLREKIKAKELKIIISVGIREELRKYFEEHIHGLKMDGWVHILSGRNINDYFEKFNKALRTTDILWTKPSELSFYAGLGLPIIIAPPLGSQEDFNKKWLLHIGAGIEEENPRYADQWLFDLLDSGDLAEMAMQGFVEIKCLGTYNIEHIINKEPSH
ncbi:MAG: hypothetical protein AAB340_00850 [Patescibacteria group bacterium]